MNIKRLLLSAFFITVSLTAQSQILKPVKWSYAAKKINASEAVLYLKATIDDGWHLYSQHIAEGGPIKTSIKFAPSSSFTLIGKTIEPKPTTTFEKVFNMKVSFFSKQVIFQQKIKFKPGATNVKGSIEYMVCDDKQCLPPEEVSFTIPLNKN
ncbi:MULTISPECIES: protein-disulfide reductase DsbD domain-containing protein [Olivibacter]